MHRVGRLVNHFDFAINRSSHLARWNMAAAADNNYDLLVCFELHDSQRSQSFKRFIL